MNATYAELIRMYQDLYPGTPLPPAEEMVLELGRAALRGRDKVAEIEASAAGILEAWTEANPCVTCQNTGVTPMVAGRAVVCPDCPSGGNPRDVAAALTWAARALRGVVVIPALPEARQDIGPLTLEDIETLKEAVTKHLRDYPVTLPTIMKPEIKDSWNPDMKVRFKATLPEDRGGGLRPMSTVFDFAHKLDKGWLNQILPGEDPDPR